MRDRSGYGFPDDVLIAILRDALESEDPMDIRGTVQATSIYSTEVEVLFRRLIRAKPTSVGDIELLLVEVFSVSFELDLVASRSSRLRRVACAIQPEWTRLADEYEGPSPGSLLR